MEILDAFFKRLIRVLLLILGFLMYPFVHLRAFKKQKKCPPINNEILLLSATELARRIRRKELSSEQVVMSYIKRCKEVNVIINAIVDERFDDAIVDARKVDKFLLTTIKSEIELNNEMPLLGVPVTVKESIAVKGMSHSSGLKIKNPIISDFDSDVILRVKKAGGIPLLVSNTPEMCMCWETYNNVTGTTWNPYNTNKTAGGSSGGEAALLASAASVVSISSDIGGSARLPALFCGVFGHKPTPEYISTHGHMPTCDDSSWSSFFSIGPMVRYSEDLTMMLKVLCQSDKFDASHLDQKVELSDIKFYYMESDKSPSTNTVDIEIINGIQRFIKHMESARGIKVQKADIKEMKYAFETSSSMLLQLNGVDTIYKKGSNPREWKSVFLEVIKYISFMSPHTFPNIAYGVLKKFVDTLPDGYNKWINDKNNLIKKRFQDLLGENGVLIYPGFTTAAHYPYEIYSKVADVSYMMIFNSIGLPVTQCPLGLNKDGLPIGFQVVGNVGKDHLTIAVAREIERAFGGWQEPPSDLKTV
ncbi:fatty-acid amide hydrolase 2-like isoform X2 [Aphidius gifuensis]|uniref:fatty-acid amide hydrolase 2-like isoform X2 n=1 Tax=Aphidius gifuensis TaxID=684658 RepID=UPI001CDD362D|nr:fatty-acid amide hydrolase 2-like isoform X2 [Aphidius gifuensis]XP_044011297.1 fatty-acid amide hydrolase 2-like isoform X2 [Aphidius gifuensis]